MTRSRTTGRRTRRIGLALLSAVVLLGTAVVVTETAADARGTTHNPYGHVKSVAQVSARYYRVSGWAVDNDSNAPLKIAVFVDGRRHARATANRAHPAVPASYGYHGAAHGFAVNVRVPLGRHLICVKSSNHGAGHPRRIGCRARTLANNPQGRLAAVRQMPGGVSYIGAAWDPNSRAPISVSMLANGKQVGGTVLANYRGHHGHGFRGHQSLPAGTYNICIVGHNTRWGVDAKIGCKTITLNYDPVGGIAKLAQIPGGVQVDGWATDPDTPAPVTVSVYDNGTLLGTTTADGASSTSSAVTHSTSTAVSKHSFSAQYQLPQGKHVICLRGTNLRWGQDAKLACQSITLNFNPRPGSSRSPRR